MIVIFKANTHRAVWMMLNRPSIPKFFLSAAAGFLVGAALVVFPGPRCGHLNWDAGDGQAREVSRIYDHNIAVNFKLKEQDRQLGGELYEKAIWLCVLQNELECLPFLMFTASLGPVILLVRSRKSAAKIEQTA